MPLRDLPSLFDPDAQAEVPATLDERAAAWIAANPAVVQRFASLALDLHRRGERMGAKALAEIIRWQHVSGERRVVGEYRINNSYVAHLARHVMERWPELDGYFETRERAA